MAKIDDDMAALRKDMDQLRGDLGVLLESIKEAGVERGRDAAGKAREAGENLRAEAERLQRSAEARVSEHPISSVLLSFGIGFLIGMILDRRR